MSCIVVHKHYLQLLWQHMVIYGYIIIPKRILHYWPTGRVIHSSLIYSRHKCQQCGALVFCFFSVWTGSWTVEFRWSDTPQILCNVILIICSCVTRYWTTSKTVSTKCIPWICYERSFSEFYLSIWNQLVFNQRLQLFVQSPQAYLYLNYGEQVTGN